MSKIKYIIYGWSNIIETFHYWRTQILFNYRKMSEYESTNRYKMKMIWACLNNASGRKNN
jgi:hypothetical protein